MSFCIQDSVYIIPSSTVRTFRSRRERERETTRDKGRLSEICKTKNIQSDRLNGEIVKKKEKEKEIEGIADLVYRHSIYLSISMYVCMYLSLSTSRFFLRFSRLLSSFERDRSSRRLNYYLSLYLSLICVGLFPLHRPFSIFLFFACIRIEGIDAIQQ